MIRVRVASALTATALLLSGCGGLTATDLPLPGGGLSGDTYRLQVEFADVLNLPQKAKVTLSGVEIGQVHEIEASGYVATVTIDVLADYPLPRGTSFELRQATALGEVFIAATRPRKQTSQVLADGAVVPLTQTGSAPSIEDTLAALSLLLNGGGLTHLKTIVDEVNTAFDGRVRPTRSLLRELTRTASVINSRRTEIDRVLRSMDSLVATVRTNDAKIDALLRDVRPAVRELADQREDFVTMLAKFDDLAVTGNDLLAASGDSAQEFLRSLGPVLDGFIALDQDLEPSLRRMVRFYERFQTAVRGSAGAGEVQIRGVTTR